MALVEILFVIDCSYESADVIDSMSHSSCNCDMALKYSTFRSICPSAADKRFPFEIISEAKMLKNNVH